MEESAAGISGLKKTLVSWAKEKGLKGNRNREQKYILGGEGGGVREVLKAKLGHTLCVCLFLMRRKGSGCQ